MVHELFKMFTWMGSEWVLVILGFLSILTVWVILDRWSELRRMASISRRFWSEHAETWFIRADGTSWEKEIATLNSNYPCLETDTLQVIQKSMQQENVEVDKVVEAYLGQRRMKLEKYVGILGTIGSNAPFVGLLGTVLGIIRAFHDISRQGIGNGLEGITGGIAEALVATAVGLLVAVPAVIFFNLLTKRIGLLVQRAQSISLLAMSQHRNR